MGVFVVWAHLLACVASIDAVPHLVSYIVRDIASVLYGEVRQAASAVDAIGSECSCRAGLEAAIAIEAYIGARFFTLGAVDFCRHGQYSPEEVASHTGYDRLRPMVPSPAFTAQ